MEDSVVEKELTVTATLTGVGKDFAGAHFTHEHRHVKVSGFDIFQAKCAEAAFNVGARVKADRAKGVKLDPNEKRVDVTFSLVGKSDDGFYSEFTYVYKNVRLSGFDIFQDEAMKAAFAVGEEVKKLKGLK